MTTPTIKTEDQSQDIAELGDEVLDRNVQETRKSFTFSGSMSPR